MIQTRQFANEVSRAADVPPDLIFAVVLAIIECLARRRPPNPVEAVFDELRNSPARFERAAWLACRREGIPRQKRPAVIQALRDRCVDPVRVGWVYNEVAQANEDTGEWTP
ncbi:MAG TPA: hypothetical protein VEA69_21285 [Tepidisphaeraceae bacterium]|nr:hypothetical protein [Tepidisphaeraceae bacterium]